MSGVVLASKKLREVRITFPVSVQVAVVKPGKTVKFRSAVAREPTMLQRIAIGMADHLRGIRIAGEISLTSRIAPSSLVRRVPALQNQCRVLPATDHAPSQRGDR